MTTGNERTGQLRSPGLSLLFDRLAASLHDTLCGAIELGSAFASQPIEAQTQLARRLVAALRHGLLSGDCAPLLSAVDLPNEGAPPTRLQTLADTQAVLSLVRRCLFQAVRLELGQEAEALTHDLIDRLTGLLFQAAGIDAQRRLGEMQTYALQQTAQYESMVALNEAQSHPELIDMVVRFVAPLEVGRALMFLYDPATTEDAAPSSATVVAAWARQLSATSTVGHKVDLQLSPLTPLLLPETVLLHEDTAKVNDYPEATRRALELSGLRGLLSAPLYLRNKLIGRLLLGWAEPRRFSFHDTRLLRAIADQTSTVAARLLLQDESTRHLRALTELRDQLAHRVEEQTAELRVFKALADNAPDGIFVTRGKDSEVIYANRSLLTMLQRTEITPALVTKGLTLEGNERRQELATHLAAKGYFQGTFHFQAADDTIVPAQLSIFSVSADGSDPSSATFAGIAHDIRDQLRSEAERIALKEQVIAAQKASLRELGAPIIPVTDGVIVMPLIGALDSDRAQQVMETLLQGVQDAHAHTVLVDVTGVRTIDTHTAGSLIRVSQSVRLLGAQVILTGLRPEVAQTLVSLGVDVSGLSTMATLQSAIARTLRKTPALTRK